MLELGAGLGVVGSVTALNARPAKVMSFEANPALIPLIRAMHVENGLEDVIELRNEVLISAADRPESMTFHVTNSFLGSSLIEKEARQTTPVEVATADYHAVAETFRPNVLLMDIESGELEFLKHADLRGLRAVVIEFHPSVYGKSGAQTCKNILRAAGFEKRDDLSTRFVWTCTRTDWRSHWDARPPAPHYARCSQVHTHKNAIVKSPDGNSLSEPSGVMEQDGTDVPAAALWRNVRRMNLPFERPTEPVEKIAGTWLWGGTLWSNFAHFVAESTSRLWAMGHLDGAQPDGGLFIPRRATAPQELHGFQTAIFKAFGVDLPIKIVSGAAEVERLLVPGQGFGLGAISAGTPAMHDYLHALFGKDITPEGSDALYISRSKLGPGKGALLGEDILEQHLAAQGFEIFHPQMHDIPTQIARFKAAKVVFGADGSAFHLFSFVGRSDQKVGLISRRKSGAVQNIVTNLAHFTGAEPAVFDVLRGVWQPEASARARLAMSEPDIPALQKALVAKGFIQDGPAWPELDVDSLHPRLHTRYARTRFDLAAE